MILILSQVIDAHADYVAHVLNARGIEFWRLHTAEFPRRATLEAETDAQGRWHATMTVHGRTLSLDRVTSVWYRRPGLFEVAAELSPEQRRYALAESRQAIGGLLRSLDCAWVNHPDALMTAEQKLVQLQVARSVGFATPRTAVTNDTAVARRFARSCRHGVLFKSMAGGVIETPGGDLAIIYSHRLGMDEIGDHEELIRYAPCLFQEYVPKRFEVRVAIFGDDVYAARIDSQSVEESKIDWRKGQQHLDFERCELPRAVRDRCLVVARRFGLAYCAIDLVVTPEGDHVFLEINPNGQWGFMQEQAMEMCESLIKLLTSGTDREP